LAASPAAKGRLSRPGLKEKLRPVGANVRARGIWCVADPQEHKSVIRVIGIRRTEKRDHTPRGGWCILRLPSLTLYDPFQDRAHGHALACQGILIDPPPKRFSHRYLARAAVVSYGDSPFPQCLKRGAL